MRITNSMVTNNYLRNLNGNMARMERYQYQLATNRRLFNLSDDPVGIVKSMQARVKLYKTEQYQKNVSTARAWLTHAETCAMELNKVLVTAYENTNRAANDFMQQDEKEAIGKLIGQLRDHVLELGNATLDDRYIFGGYNTKTKPFSVNASGDLLYNGLDFKDLSAANLAALDAEDAKILEFEIGFGLRTQAAVPGTKLLGMGEDNIYNMMNDLYNVLMDPDSTATDISPYIEKLQAAQQQTLSYATDLGGKTNRLDMIDDRYESDVLNYTELKSSVEDTKQAETIMNFKMAESVYLSALQTGAKIIQPSLLNYLS
ncbi:MAG: flagellar hook-associated protein FlgL [Christensenellales bacterium]|jgi:flagellar hook-associated protein 3 FlgL